MSNAFSGVLGNFRNNCSSVMNRVKSTKNIFISIIYFCYGNLLSLHNEYAHAVASFIGMAVRSNCIRFLIQSKKFCTFGGVQFK